MVMNELEMPTLTTDVHTELLVSASSSILSSFSMRNDCDIGVNLSIRLLLPHITPENTRLCAHAASILERHYPQSDSGAHTLLQMCEDFVKRGSRRMLDACDSIALSRYQYHKRRRDMDTAVTWLMKGINFASSMKSEDEGEALHDFMLTACYRHLVDYCITTTSSILMEIVQYSSSGDSSTLLHRLQGNNKILTTIFGDGCAPIISSKAYISLLSQEVDLGMNFINDDYSLAAANIIKCLEDGVDEENTVTTLAHPSLYGHFLSLAYDIMGSEDIVSPAKLSIFDVNGIHTLLARFTEGFTMESKLVSYGQLREDITVKSMRLALANGLMRAFIRENAEIEKNSQGSAHNVDKIENEVEVMLGPSLW